ncbi:MAG: energy transducer TonB, partial [Pseudorhodoplanes sp.]
LGAVVPSRGDSGPASPSTPESDLSNVIPFASRVRKTGGKKTPALKVAADDRPAPWALSTERQRQIALLIGGSLLVHGAIFAAFNREPEPHASIGVISVTAEIVLGSQMNAGQSPTPSESEIASAASPKTDEPVDTKPEIARKNPAEASSKAEQAIPVEIVPVPNAQAELVVQPKPAEKPTLKPDEKKPDAKDAKKIREAARHTKNDGESARDRAAPASTPSNASSGIGRGRSDADTNYRGIVAAHLARYKQFPAEARSRGDQGTTTVTFSLSGSGSVTSVRLVRGSGVSSIDRETTAMVQRASPFPAPPSGRGMSFTVPVSFHLR